MIRSKLHDALSLLPACELRDRLSSDPLFLFAHDTVEILVGPQASKSMSALTECGVVHLPYPRMTVQFYREVTDIHWIVSLHDQGEGKFSVWPVAIHVDSAIPTRTAVDVMAEQGGFKVWCDDVDSEYAPYIATGAATMGVLMTHVSGLEREAVEPPERLNKRRQRSGKPPVAGYHYVHVARVYDASGRAHERSGKRMPVHMRAGHVRNQAYGPNRENRKMVWIPPVLVNYCPGDTEGPVIEKRVVK